MHCFSTSPHLKESAGHWRICWHFGGHCVGHWTLCRGPSGSGVNRRYKDTRKHPDKYKTDKDQNKCGGGTWWALTSLSQPRWIQLSHEQAGWWNFVKQSIRPLLHYHYYSAHRKRQTQQSWYILIALNAAYKGLKSGSIKNPNSKTLCLLMTERQLRQSIIQLLHYHYPDPQETSVNSYQTTGDYAPEEPLPTNDGGAHIFIIKLR